jgi:hypothetical protein
MNLHFEEHVERAHYYERFDFVKNGERIQTIFRQNKETRMEETIIEC